MMHIRPLQGVKTSLFLLDNLGNPAKWTHFMFSQYTPWKISKDRLSASITCNYTCREEASYELLQHIRELKLPFSYKTTVTPTNSEVTGVSTLASYVGGSLDGRYVYSRVPAVRRIYKKGYELSTSKKSAKQVFDIMDTIVGTVALLMAGPAAYIRPKVGLNPYTRSEPVEKEYHRRVRTKLSDYGTHTENTARVTYIATNTLQYTGVSNFYMSHPASFSIITGLTKNCLQMWFDGLYEKIDKKINITHIKNRLSYMSRKKKLSEADKEELLATIKKVRPYLYGKRSRVNAGAYPLNKHTHTMFLKYITTKTPSDVKSVWNKSMVTDSSSPYGTGDYGFITWCKSRKVKTKEFSAALNVSWSGTQGSQVGLGGHGQPEYLQV